MISFGVRERSLHRVNKTTMAKDMLQWEVKAALIHEDGHRDNRYL